MMNNYLLNKINSSSIFGTWKYRSQKHCKNQLKTELLCFKLFSIATVNADQSVQEPLQMLTNQCKNRCECSPISARTAAKADQSSARTAVNANQLVPELY